MTLVWGVKIMHSNYQINSCGLKNSFGLFFKMHGFNRPSIDEKKIQISLFKNLEIVISRAN